MYVDRESLLKKKKANVILRPRLFINDTPASLKILEEITFSIASFDEENVKSLKEIPNFQLNENQESVYEFQVPDNVRSFEFTLKAKVKLVSQNNKVVDLLSTQSFHLNKIDSTDSIKDEHLSHSKTGYKIMVLGRVSILSPLFFSLYSFVTVTVTVVCCCY